jgi:hypothetical protein
MPDTRFHLICVSFLLPPIQNPDPLKCADEWATETAGLACTFAYSDVDGSHIQDGFTLGEDYYQVRARETD